MEILNNTPTGLCHHRYRAPVAANVGRLSMCAVPTTLLVLVSLIGSLLGCAAIPSPEDPQSSAIGIRFETRVPIYGHLPHIVFFVRTENDSDIAQSQVIRSNFARRGRLYLLNAPPGKYAAVASFRSDQYAGYLTVFSKELIDSTRVEVVPGTLAFMGSYFLGESVRMGSAEPIQKHYAELLAPGMSGNVVKQFLVGYRPYRGTMRKGRRDDSAQAEFLAESREDFARSGWEESVR